jgi:hypothetical protein
MASLNPPPRLIRSTPDPLGLFLRVGRNDHGEILDLLARGDAQFFGLIIESTAVKRQKELRERALASRLDVILDPRTQAAATVGGNTESLTALPWGLDRPAVPADFSDVAGRRRIQAIAEVVIDNGFTQVLAPTHSIASSTDPWLSIDAQSTRRLRHQLDRAGASHVQIPYSLAIPYSVLRDDDERESIIHDLRDVPMDSLWLQIEGLGSDATANGIRSYIRGACTFQALGKPLVADGIGGLAGLSLLAFGATGGLAHGVTFGERVDHSAWRRPRDKANRFGPARRVYVPELDLLLEPKVAAFLIHSSTRAKGLFGCRDTQCCPRGIRDMQENRARHFLIQRMKQVGKLGQWHLPLRAGRFVEEMVRPASDMLVQATNWNLKDVELGAKLGKQRRRLDAVRTALNADVANIEQRSAVVPKTRSARELRHGI